MYVEPYVSSCGVFLSAEGLVGQGLPSGPVPSSVVPTALTGTAHMQQLNGARGASWLLAAGGAQPERLVI